MRQSALAKRWRSEVHDARFLPPCPILTRFAVRLFVLARMVASALLLNIWTSGCSCSCVRHWSCSPRPRARWAATFSRGRAAIAMANSKYEYVKNYEQDDRLLPGCFIVVRLDGKGFTKCGEPLFHSTLSLPTQYRRHP